jgi:hypothetical protein
MEAPEPAALTMESMWSTSSHSLLPIKSHCKAAADPESRGHTERSELERLLWMVSCKSVFEYSQRLDRTSWGKETRLPDDTKQAAYKLLPSATYAI